MKKPLIILTGPTAVGKTRLSLDLCKAINGSVISADSVQVYRRMDIGSAKIFPEQMEGVRHYLIDILEPQEEFNVSLFTELAKQAIEDIYGEGKIPVLVGGTGFYIQALIRDVQFSQSSGQLPLRRELEAQAETPEGREALFAKLSQVDPESAAIIHPNNVKRVIRALEFYEETGTPISAHNETEKQRTSPYDFVYYVLTDDRQVLYERINQRVDQMLEDGLLDEVKRLRAEGLQEGMTAWQALGYKEFYPYLDGQCSLNDAVEKLKMETRRFAKRQLTWFRREDEVCWIDKRDYHRDDQEILKFLLDDIKSRGLLDQ